MNRQCPYCGASIPDNALTCPNCYKEVPRKTDPGRQERYDSGGYTDSGAQRLSNSHKSRSLTMLLATVPAFFGLLGLGQLYQDYHNEKGWVFLALGLILYGILVMMILAVAGHGLATAVLLTIAIIVFALLYLSTAIAALVDAYLGSFRIFGLHF